jgi:hypothetical protein
MHASILNAIPDPVTIRQQLAVCVREAAILRRMLRLAEQAAKDKAYTEAAAPHAQRAQRSTSSRQPAEVARD